MFQKGHLGVSEALKKVSGVFQDVLVDLWGIFVGLWDILEGFITA